jgi:hypothetical protein
MEGERQKVVILGGGTQHVEAETFSPLPLNVAQHIPENSFICRVMGTDRLSYPSTSSCIQSGPIETLACLIN